MVVVVCLGGVEIWLNVYFFGAVLLLRLGWIIVVGVDAVVIVLGYCCRTWWWWCQVECAESCSSNVQVQQKLHEARCYDAGHATTTTSTTSTTSTAVTAVTAATTVKFGGRAHVVEQVLTVEECKHVIQSGKGATSDDDAQTVL